MNTTLHCNQYTQLKYFVIVVSSGIVEFIHKDMTSSENKATKQALPSN